jgi:hypothetical protein
VSSIGKRGSATGGAGGALSSAHDVSFLKSFNLLRFMLIYLSLLDIFVPLPFVYPPFLAYFWLHRYRLFIYSFYF